MMHALCRGQAFKSWWQKGIFLLLILVLPCSTSADVLAEREGYQLTSIQVENMIRAGESIAQQAFSDAEKQGLQDWATQLFQQEKGLPGVLSAFSHYDRYLQLAAKHNDTDLQALIWHHLYRKMLFKWRFPRYQQDQATLLDVIRRYNPPIIKNDQEQLLLAKKDPLLLQQDGYFVSQPLWQAVQLVTAFLGQAEISQTGKEGLYQWFLADFRHAPQQASKAYANFLDHVFPHVLLPQALSTQEQYRRQLYQQYYFLFREHSLSKQWESDLMDIALHSNPVLAIDEQNQVLLSHSEWQDSLKALAFFSDQLQLGHDFSAGFQEAERQRLLSRFINRKNPQQPLAESIYLLRSQEFWHKLSETEQRELSVLMKKEYQQTGDIWQALQPLFGRLDQVIQLENQQKALQQQIMTGLLLQQLQVNQTIYNNTLQAYREVGDSMSRAIREQSFRQSISVTGGKILETNRDHYIIENDRGDRYTVNREP
ncbi:MAG: hypothetical protein ACPG51_05845 [Thiolinea sp.]